jgi:hypothetical protein
MSTPHDAWEAIYHHERSRRESHGDKMPVAAPALASREEEDMLERSSLRKTLMNKEELIDSHSPEGFPSIASFSDSEVGVVSLDVPAAVGVDCHEDALRSPISPLLPSVIAESSDDAHCSGVLQDEILKQRQVSLSFSLTPS